MIEKEPTRIDYGSKMFLKNLVKVFILLLTFSLIFTVWKITSQPDWNTRWEQVWKEDFSSLEYWRVNRDLGVGCSDEEEEDVAYKLTSVQTHEGSEGQVLQIEANTRHRTGVFVNAIAHREIGYYPERSVTRYKVDTEVLISQDEDPAYFSNLTLHFVKDQIGHAAVIRLWTDPHTPQFGHVTVRDGLNRHISLMDLGDDMYGWHVLEMATTVNEIDNQYRIDWIRVDGQTHILNWPMPYFPKDGWPRIAQVYLEQHNKYDACNPEFASKGVSFWDDVSIYSADVSS